MFSGTWNYRIYSVIEKHFKRILSELVVNEAIAAIWSFKRFWRSFNDGGVEKLRERQGDKCPLVLLD